MPFGSIFHCLHKFILLEKICVQTFIRYLSIDRGHSLANILVVFQINTRLVRFRSRIGAFFMVGIGRERTNIFFVGKNVLASRFLIHQLIPLNYIRLFTRILILIRNLDILQFNRLAECIFVIENFSVIHFLNFDKNDYNI